MPRTKPRTALAALLVAASMSAPLLVASPGAAAPKVAADPRVVPEWNVIAARTIVTENGLSAPVSALYFGFVSLAVYDAVVAIEGRYEPYAQLPRPHAHASPEVAAATAAYRVLSHYFPVSADALAADYAATLDRSPRGVGRVHGQRVGRDAADTVIASRQRDGRDAGPPFQGVDGIGLWKAAEGGTMLAPWLGSVRPLTLNSPTQLPLPGPDAVSSVEYATDFDEVKAYGASEGVSSRTPEQTATARFWTVSPVLQYHAALRQQVAARGLDITDSARTFALLGSATADALIACWRAKVDYNYWRPQVAIRKAGADGNDATQPDADWTSLVPAPPYPEYPSGHACVTGAASEIFTRLFGATGLGLQVPSGPLPVRRFDTTQALDSETMNARIWLGIHFRRAMTDGNALGHGVASWAETRYFRPTG